MSAVPLNGSGEIDCEMDLETVAVRYQSLPLEGGQTTVMYTGLFCLGVVHRDRGMVR